MPERTARSVPPRPSPDAIAALAPTGELRVGINLSNFLLVSGADAQGTPVGVSPSLAAALAEGLEVPLRLVPVPDPGELVDALAAGEFDLGNVGADPDRAELLAFSDPYCEIQATYLVRGDSPIVELGDVDRPGHRIVSKARAAYTLWLDRYIERAEVIHTDTVDGSFERFVADGLEVLAGLRSRLVQDADRLPGGRVLDGSFAAVHQAIGVPRSRGEAAVAHLDQFVRWSIESGLVATLVDRFDVPSLSVAPVRS